MNRLFLLTTLLCLGLGTSYGQGALTLSDAMAMALSGNKQVEINKSKEKIAFSEKRIASSLRMPTLGVTASYVLMSEDIGSFDLNSLKPTVEQTLTDMLPLFAANGVSLPTDMIQELLQQDWSFTLQDREFGLVGITASQPVFTGGKINAANKAAKIGMEQESVNTNIDNAKLVSEVVERYYGLALAVQVAQLRQEAYEGMMQHLEDARRLEESGMIAKVERLYFQVKVSEAESELQKAQMLVKTLSSALSASLGSGESYTPVSQMRVLPSIGALESYKSLALEQSPLLRQVELSRELAQQALKAERADYYPHVALMGGYDAYNYQLTEYAPKWVVGAGVSLTLFNGLSRENKVIKAKTTVKMVDAIEDKAREDIAVLVEKEYNAVMSAYQSFTSSEVTIEFAQEYLRVKELAFKAGSATAAETTDAMLNLVKAKVERLSSAFEFNKQLSKLLESCGESDSYVDYIMSASAKAVEY